MPTPWERRTARDEPTNAVDPLLVFPDAALDLPAILRPAIIPHEELEHDSQSSRRSLQ